MPSSHGSYQPHRGPSSSRRLSPSARGSQTSEYYHQHHGYQGHQQSHSSAYNTPHESSNPRQYPVKPTFESLRALDKFEQQRSSCQDWAQNYDPYQNLLATGKSKRSPQETMSKMKEHQRGVDYGYYESNLSSMGLRKHSSDKSGYGYSYRGN